MISYPSDSEPFIKWNHIDGPMLVCRDGTPHFLTNVERIWLKFGFTTIKILDDKYCMEPQRGV